jgi:hypothetical protein
VTQAEKEEMLQNAMRFSSENESLELFQAPLSQFLQRNPSGVLQHNERVVTTPELGIVSPSQESESSSGLVSEEVGLGAGEDNEEPESSMPCVSGNTHNDCVAHLSVVVGTLREHPDKLNAWLQCFHKSNNKFLQMVRESHSDKAEHLGEYVSILPASDTRKSYKRLKSSTEPRRKKGNLVRNDCKGKMEGFLVEDIS